MSPDIFGEDGLANVFKIGFSGSIIPFEVRADSFTGVRPVINLKADVTISSGNGSAENPFEVLP